MEKEHLEDVIDIAHIFLEKACAESIKISYNKLQCLIYQSNKAYYHYKNELFFDTDTITSNIGPVNVRILTEFSSFKDRDYISYTTSKKNKEISIGLMKTIFLEYIWDNYSPMNDKKILDCTLEDIIFENKSGVDITKDSFKNETKDESIKSYIEFLTK